LLLKKYLSTPEPIKWDQAYHRCQNHLNLQQTPMQLKWKEKEDLEKPVEEKVSDQELKNKDMQSIKAKS
jgi:hypothetical protein